MAKRPSKKKDTKTDTSFNLDAARQELYGSAPATPPVTQGERKMAYEHKENRGTLFLNEPKAQPTDPDYGGTANIGGVVFRLAMNAAKNPANGLNGFTVTGEGISGFLYNNRGRKKNPAGPDVSGTLDVNGSTYKASGWDNHTKAGAPVLKFEFQTEAAAKARAEAARAAVPVGAAK